MVDIVRSTYRTVPTRSFDNKVKELSQVETFSGESVGQPYVIRRDRRRNRDRRRGIDGARPVYEMRSGRGLRRDDVQASFDTQA